MTSAPVAPTCDTRRAGALEEEIHLAILRVAALFEHAVGQALKPYDITQTQYNVLRILRGKSPDGYARGDIASRMIDRAPDVTRLIDRLERRGLVERMRSDSDRRLSLTCITRKGLNLLAKLDPGIDAIDERITEKMSARDLKALSRLCERVYGVDLTA